MVTKNNILIINTPYYISLSYISADHIYVIRHANFYVILLSGNYLFLRRSIGNPPFFHVFFEIGNFKFSRSGKKVCSHARSSLFLADSFFLDFEWSHKSRKDIVTFSKITGTENPTVLQKKKKPQEAPLLWTSVQIEMIAAKRYLCLLQI